jgi:hypothetical protein
MLKKGRGWFLNFLGAPSIILEIRIFLISRGKCDCELSWLIKLASYFHQSLLITGRVYCPMIKVDWLPADVLLRELAIK